MRIIALDFGHGETKLCWLDAGSANAQEPNSVELFPGKKRIPTAIGYQNGNRVILLGEYAIEQDCTTLFLGFKTKPSLITYEVREVIKDFVRTIRDRCVANGIINDENNVRFIVGCPSSWNDDEVRAYEDLFREAGPTHVSVMRESRAALLQVRDTTIEKELRNQSILVIDIGSLTTDLTVLSGTEDIPIDAGVQLGGGLLDKAIMRHDLATSPERANLTALLEREPVYRVRYEYWCRKAKEEFFSSDPKFFEDPDSRPYSKRYHGHHFEPRFNCSVVEQLLDEPLQELGGLGWRPCFRQLLKAFRNNQVDDRGLQLSRIVLTGGGSRMTFVQQLCEETFPEVRILKDGDPELCIARGLARRGAVETRTAKFAERMDAYVMEQLPGLVDSRIDELIANLSSTLAEGGVNDVVLVEFGRWKRGSVKTIHEMENNVKARLPEWLKGSEAKARIEQACSNWGAKVLQQVQEDTLELFREFGLFGGIFTSNVVLESSGKSVPMEDFRIADPTILSPIIGNIAAVITGYVTFMLTAQTLIALEITGPFIALFVVIGAIIAAVMGKEYVEDKIKGWDLPQAIRWTVSENKIKKKSMEKLPDISAKLKEAILKRDDIVGELRTVTQRVISEAVNKAADRARLIIR